MSRAVRTALFGLSAAGFAALFVWGLLGLPDFGDFRGAYGVILNRIAVGQRHVTNVPAAVNFDYRAFDTLGEEFILFAGAVGLAVIRRSRREHRRPGTERAVQFGPASDAVRVLGLFSVGPLLVLGWYIVTHGQLTPGGGFQGGVILSTGLLMVYLAGEVATVRRLRPWPLIEVTKSAGAGGYAVIGLAGLIGTGALYANVLPLGPIGQVESGGTIPLSNLSVSLAVSAALVLVYSELVDQALVSGRGT